MRSLLGNVWFCIFIWIVAFITACFACVNHGYDEGRRRGWNSGLDFTLQSMKLKHAVQLDELNYEVAQDSLEFIFRGKYDSLLVNVPWYIRTP